MTGSLQDQLLNAGLSDSKKAKQLAKEKRKQQRVNNKAKEVPTDEVKAAAQQAREEKAARDRALNQARNEAANRKAIQAQITQLIETNKVDRQGGDVGFNFTANKLIKKIYVTPLQQKLLSAGKLAIAPIGDGFELIPAQVAEKVAERDPERVIFCADNTGDTLTDQEREWYGDFEIPDDLMW